MYKKVSTRLPLMDLPQGPLESIIISLDNLQNVYLLKQVGDIINWFKRYVYRYMRTGLFLKGILMIFYLKL